jgi:hypothetical protein
MPSDEASRARSIVIDCLAILHGLLDVFGSKPAGQAKFTYDTADSSIDEYLAKLPKLDSLSQRDDIKLTFGDKADLRVYLRGVILDNKQIALELYAKCVQPNPHYPAELIRLVDIYLDAVVAQYMALERPGHQPKTFTARG